MGSIAIHAGESTSYSPGLNFNNFRVLGLSTPQRHAIGRGFYPVGVGSVPSEITLELLRYPDFDTVISELENTRDRQFTVQKCDVGSGEFSIQLDDADFSSVVRGGDMFVRFKRFDIGCLVMAVEHYVQVSLAEDDDESKKMVTWTGPGHLTIIDDACVYPARGVEKKPKEVDRPFDWTEKNFDDSGWFGVVVLCTWVYFRAAWFFAHGGAFIAGGSLDTPTAGADGFKGVADLTPVLTPPFSTIMSSAGPADHYWRQEITITVGFFYTFRGWSTGPAEFLIDGQNIAQNEGWGTQCDALVELSVGTHVVAWHVHNYAEGTGIFDWGNPCAAAWDLFLAGGIFESIVPTAQSDTTAKAMYLATVPPGMTIGEIAIICLTEAQARGCFPTLTWSFTAKYDSNGVAWDVLQGVATKVGTKLLAFFLELCATYMDMRMQPGGLILDLFVKGTMGRATGTIWDEEFITALEQEGEA